MLLLLFCVQQLMINSATTEIHCDKTQSNFSKSSIYQSTLYYEDNKLEISFFTHERRKCALSSSLSNSVNSTVFKRFVINSEKSSTISKHIMNKKKIVVKFEREY